jgi:hypothetical protein
MKILSQSCQLILFFMLALQASVSGQPGTIVYYFDRDGKINFPNQCQFYEHWCKTK